MQKDAIFWSRFFIAVPEAVLEDALIDYLKAKGLISEEALENARMAQKKIKKIQHFQGRLKGKTMLARLMIIAPEIISRSTVDVLAKFGLLEQVDANFLRLALRLGAIGKGGPATPLTLLLRAKKVFGYGFASDTLSLAVSMGHISKKDADKFRATLLINQSVTETLESLVAANNLRAILMLVANGVVNQKNINAMRLAGLLDNRTANAVLEALDYGTSLWTVFEGSKRAEGYMARLAYTLSGAFSHEAMDVLKAIQGMKQGELDKLGIGWMHGRLTPERMALLQIATQLSQRFNRQMMEQMTNRRYRVVPGESPIVSFARSTKQTEDDILQLLSRSAADARKRAKLLAGTARGHEYNIRAASLHQAMRELWEGIGLLTINGESDVADAAYESSTVLHKRFYDKMPQPVATMLQFQAKSGLDSFISRKENTKELSSLVYGNLNLWTGKVDNQINMGLLQGQSADEIARRVQSMINPNVPGGVRYAALRLGRTEVANAFHQTTIRYSREMPWVRGYHWNTSKSHDHDDICNRLATDDPDGLGEGNYKKNNVPDKPHPQCMCYLTVVTVDDADFVKFFNKGYYNSYINSRLAQAGGIDPFVSQVFQTGASVLGTAAGTLALSAAGSLAERMLSGGFHLNPGFNPLRWRGLNKAELTDEVQDIQKAAGTGKRPLIAKTVNVEAMTDDIAKEEVRLRRRQDAFQVLADEYGKGDPEENIENAYKTFFPGEDPDKGQGIRLITNFGDKGEDAAKNLYGMTWYRTFNTRMRLARGDLKAYDAQFPDGEKFFKDMGEMVDDLTHGDADAGIDLMNHTARFLEKDMTHPPTILNKVFGNRRDDLKDHYAEIMDIATNWYGDSKINNLWTNGMSNWKRHSDVARALDRSMMPSQKDAFLWRISDHKWMGLPAEPTAADIGHEFIDDAIVSTEGRPTYFMNQGVNSLDIEHREIRYMIMAPQGTMGTRLNSFENEIGLSRGTRFQVLQVAPGAEGFAHTVYLSVVDQKKVWEEAAEAFAERDEDDMWDQIMGEF